MFVLNKIALQLEQRSNLKCHFRHPSWFKLVLVDWQSAQDAQGLVFQGHWIDKCHSSGMSSALLTTIIPIPTNPGFQATVLLQGPVIVVVCCCLLLFGLCSKIDRHNPHLHRQDISGPALITSPHVTKPRCFLPCGNSHGRQWRAIHMMFRKISPK